METEVPVFAIKATDQFAVQTIRAHIRQCWGEGLYHQVDEETLALAEIIAWQRANPDKVHLPDHEHVPAEGWASEVAKIRDMREPHSRSCGIKNHDHGPDCSENCPTCHGRP